jgi:uncharacterized protein (DUF305 family)
MKRSISITVGPLLALAAACSSALHSAATSTGPTQAGAPRTPAELAAANHGHPPFVAADVNFMSGMIGHHAQAVLMASWAPTHGASPAVQRLCERIGVAQTDEIKFMQTWLRDRNQEVPPADPRGHVMPGMGPMLMPGMLTPEQMKQLDAARGVEFDRLFLTFMIQHHRGALTMVETLLGSYGAAQDEAVYKFSSDVTADQSTEIERMNLMLAALPTR